MPKILGIKYEKHSRMCSRYTVNNRAGNFRLGHSLCLGCKSHPNLLTFLLDITNLISYRGLFFFHRILIHYWWSHRKIENLVVLDFLKEQPILVRELVSEVFPQPRSFGTEMFVIKLSCVNLVIENYWSGFDHFCNRCKP